MKLAMKERDSEDGKRVKFAFYIVRPHKSRPLCSHKLCSGLGDKVKVVVGILFVRLLIDTFMTVLAHTTPPHGRADFLGPPHPAPPQCPQIKGASMLTLGRLGVQYWVKPQVGVRVPCSDGVTQGLSGV